jgi:hypothetical protein
MEHWCNDSGRGKQRIEHWWNDSGRGKLKYSEKNLCQSYFVHHKAHMGSNPGIRGKESATNGLRHCHVLLRLKSN